MLEEQQGAVVDARQPGPESAVVAQGPELLLDKVLELLPRDAKGRVGEHVIKNQVREAVVCEGIAELDVIGVFTLDHHV